MHLSRSRHFVVAPIAPRHCPPRSARTPIGLGGSDGRLRRALLVVAGAAFVPSASAAQAVQLGTATPFAVLACSAVTDVPTSSITGDVGLSPAAGTNYAGLTQAEVTGTIYSTDGTGPAGNSRRPALLTTAKNDLTTAYTQRPDSHRPPRSRPVTISSAARPWFRASMPSVLRPPPT